MVKNFVVDYNTETFEPLMEHEVNGLDYKYVYGNDRLSVDISPINNSMSIVENGDHIRLYYHMDYLGTADYLTSPVSGKVEAWTHYNEWGLIVHNAVLKCGQRELDLVKRYATHDYDSVLELYYAKARFYDAHDRRFTAVDPILDPSGYDLREYVQNPVQLVQYLYVVNNPILFTDLLGLNPTNALLNMDWSKVSAKDGPADNVREKEQYVKLNNVWRQLQNYYPGAGITSNGEYEAYTISHGGKYLQIQIQSESGNAEISTLVNNKYQSQSVQKIKIGDGYAISKRELESYFRQVWCEDYYLTDVPITDTRYILDSFAIALSNTELLDIRAGEKKALEEARKYIITGNATHCDNRYVGIEMENSERIKSRDASMKKIVEGANLLFGAFAPEGYALEVFVSNLIVSGANDDLKGAILGGTVFLKGDFGNEVKYLVTGKGYADFLKNNEAIFAPENDYITLSVMSAGGYIMLRFEITPNGELIGIYPVRNNDYKLGYEYQSHKNEIPPDLKYRYEITPRGKIIGTDLRYDSI